MLIMTAGMVITVTAVMENERWRGKGDGGDGDKSMVVKMTDAARDDDSQDHGHFNDNNDKDITDGCNNASHHRDGDDHTDDKSYSDGMLRMVAVMVVMVIMMVMTVKTMLLMKRGLVDADGGDSSRNEERQDGSRGSCLISPVKPLVLCLHITRLGLFSVAQVTGSTERAYKTTEFQRSSRLTSSYVLLNS